MSFKIFFAALPLLYHGVTAIPAGPGYFPDYDPSNDTDVVELSLQSMNVAAFSLVETYNKDNWGEKFDFQDIIDPTHGFVHYVDKPKAKERGFFKQSGDSIYMGVDHTTTMSLSGKGRPSVRVQSKKSYHHGLFIANIEHAPASVCGAWPAYWMVGPNWPNHGEIDIYEGVNLDTYNQVTLHTSPGCVPTVGKIGQSGTRVGPADCGAGGGFEGCGIRSTSSSSFGNGFNGKSGGVYAMLWTDKTVKVWHFPKGSVPKNIDDGKPDPESWGQPVANYGGCDFEAKFKKLNIVFDITFCGDWAGGVWGSSSCAAKNPSCHSYVANNPSAFKDVYWKIKYLKVYSI